MSKRENKENNEAGFSMLDVLLAMMFLGIVLSTYARNSVSTYQGVDKTARYANALSIAEQNLEALIQVNPLTLDNTDDVTDTVIQDNITYSRDIDITVNANGSRFIEIEIESISANQKAEVRLEHTAALWGAL